MRFEFSGTVFHWRGPSPFHFIRVPEEQAADIQGISRSVSYGWGMIPAQVTIGNTSWKTSLFPKDGSYLLPLRDFVRADEQLEIDDDVQVTMEI